MEKSNTLYCCQMDSCKHLWLQTWYICMWETQGHTGESLFKHKPHVLHKKASPNMCIKMSRGFCLSPHLSVNIKLMTVAVYFHNNSLHAVYEASRKVSSSFVWFYAGLQQECLTWLNLRRVYRIVASHFDVESSSCMKHTSVTARFSSWSMSQKQKI